MRWAFLPMLSRSTGTCLHAITCLLYTSQQGGHHDVPPGAQLAVHLEPDPGTELVEHQRRLRFRQPQLPRQSGVKTDTGTLLLGAAVDRLTALCSGFGDGSLPKLCIRDSLMVGEPVGTGREWLSICKREVRLSISRHPPA